MIDSVEFYSENWNPNFDVNFRKRYVGMSTEPLVEIQNLLLQSNSVQ